MSAMNKYKKVKLYKKKLLNDAVFIFLFSVIAPQCFTKFSQTKLHYIHISQVVSLA